jgi:hypothetical protein
VSGAAADAAEPEPKEAELSPLPPDATVDPATAAPPDDAPLGAVVAPAVPDAVPVCVGAVSVAVPDAPVEVVVGSVDDGPVAVAVVPGAVDAGEVALAAVASGAVDVVGDVATAPPVVAVVEEIAVEAVLVPVAAAAVVLDAGVAVLEVVDELGDAGAVAAAPVCGAAVPALWSGATADPAP